MKNVLKGFILWTSIIAIIILVSGVVELLASIITIEMFITVVYIALGYSFIYILKA